MLTLFLLAPSAVGQTEPTLRVDPGEGPPGTTIDLEGEGWPTSPDSITVTWGFQGQAMESNPQIIDGALSGTAVIPESAAGELGRIEVCAFEPGSDDVADPSDLVCSETQFEVTPVLRVTPETGVPGTEVTLTGAGFPRTSQPRSWEVRWMADGTVIGSALAAPDGTIEGSGTIPADAAEGLSTIAVCQFDVDLGDVCHQASPDFEVHLPTATIEPPEARPLGSLAVAGEGWCCGGATGTVVDGATGDQWGEVEVDEAGSLTGVATVPEEAQPGEATLMVCVADRLCREVSIQVLPITATTTTPTSTITLPTTTVGPGEPNQCAVLAGSLIVEPSSGEPGTAILVTVIGTTDSPPGCRATLRLAGELTGEPFELIANTASLAAATVPDGIATGGAALDVLDMANGNVLASTSFEVDGGGLPWMRVLVAALVVAVLGLAMYRLYRRLRKPRPILGVPPVPPRWVEARLFAWEDGVQVPVEYFRPHTTHRIEVRLGPADSSSSHAHSQQLRLVLTEPRLLAGTQSADVTISDAGPSTSASFTLTTGPETDPVAARLLLMNGTRVAQTALLPSTIGPAPEVPVTNVAQTETVVRAPDVPEEGKGVVAAVVVDGGLAPIITQVAHNGQAAVIGLSESGTEAVDRIRDRLSEVTEAPEEFAGLDSERTRGLLVFLAHHGRLLRSAIVDDFLGEQLAGGSSLQVVSAAPDAYLPFELAYDFTAPNLDAAVCPRAGDTLRSSEVEVSCPGTHDESVVCPMGFWGLSKVIERHAFQAAENLPAGFLVRAQPLGQRNRVPLTDGVLVAASDRVDANHPGTVEHLVRWAVAAAGVATRAESWAIWDRDVAKRHPAVLALLPHTVHSDELGSFGLEIGAADRRWAAQVDGQMIPDRPVVVALLGCETAVAGRLSYERFPGLLRRAGAEIVIATLTEVLGRHAAPLAERLVTMLHERFADRPGRLGEVVLLLRRQLLAEGLPMVLALAVFGDGDWVVGGR